MLHKWIKRFFFACNFFLNPLLFKASISDYQVWYAFISIYYWIIPSCDKSHWCPIDDTSPLTYFTDIYSNWLPRRLDTYYQISPTINGSTNITYGKHTHLLFTRYSPSKNTIAFVWAEHALGLHQTFIHLTKMKTARAHLIRSGENGFLFGSTRVQIMPLGLKVIVSN